MGLAKMPVFTPREEKAADCAEHKGCGGTSCHAEHPNNCQKKHLNNLEKTRDGGEHCVLGGHLGDAERSQDYDLHGGGKGINPHHAVVPDSLGRVLRNGQRYKHRYGCLTAETQGISSNITGSHLDHAKPAAKEDKQHLAEKSKGTVSALRDASDNVAWQETDVVVVGGVVAAFLSRADLEATLLHVRVTQEGSASNARNDADNQRRDGEAKGDTRGL
jgi:hypothetical protein